MIQITGSDGSSFPAKRYVVSKGGQRQLVLYWFQAHGRAVASEYWAKYYLMYDSIRMNRSDGALVRLMTPMFDGETPDTAQNDEAWFAVPALARPLHSTLIGASPWAESSSSLKTWRDFCRVGLMAIQAYSPLASVTLDAITTERIADFARPR